jgi:hypothetical protein
MVKKAIHLLKANLENQEIADIQVSKVLKVKEEILENQVILV